MCVRGRGLLGLLGLGVRGAQKNPPTGGPARVATHAAHAAKHKRNMNAT